MTNESLLPSHVQEAVEAIAEMHAAHHREASCWERATDRIIAAVGRPQTLIAAALAVGLWIWAALRLSFWPDRPPFALLDFALGLIAISLSVLILASQRRADRLNQRRQQMALEVALLAEHKSSKIIDLLEELRRDLPNVKNRFDLEALEMAAKPDHETVLEIIEEKAAPDEA